MDSFTVKRIFGFSNPAASRAEASNRIQELETKRDGLRESISDIESKVKKEVAKNGLCNRALCKSLLREKATLTGDLEYAEGQIAQLRGARTTLERLQDAKITVDIMEDNSKEMKKAIKKVDLSRLEKTRNEIEDFMEDSREIQDVLSRSYGIGDEGVTDEDLAMELSELESQVHQEDLQDFGSKLVFPDIPTGSPSKTIPTATTDPIGTRNTEPEKPGMWAPVNDGSTKVTFF